jgi:hypothetical protein
VKDKSSLKFMARWLVVLLTSLLVLDSGAGKTSAAAPQEQACSACVRCQCCVQEAPAPSNPPLAPASSQRASLQKDFQWLLTPSVFLSLPAERAGSLSLAPFPVSLPAAAPLYQRHCTYLI